MKEEIIKLRLNGLSYSKISKKLGCSKSTISYHCKSLNINESFNKITDDIIEDIQTDRNKGLTIKKLSNKYNISESSVKRLTYSNKKINNKELKKNKCLNCNKKSYNKFCSSKCSNNYKHKLAYKDFLENNDKYCRSNYTPKGFKDFFLEEQKNKCKICNNEPIWNNKKLVFIIDHIDGDASNNKRENLRLICPNCDSQLSTFKSKNKNSKRRNYWKEKIIKNVKESWQSG